MQRDGGSLDQHGGRGEKRAGYGYVLKVNPTKPGFQSRCGGEERENSRILHK